MLSSFRDQKRLLSYLACASTTALAPMVVGAADGYVIPQVEAWGEYHTNRDLRPSSLDLDQSVEGYFASVGGIFGLQSRRGRTEARPRLQFEEYPDRDELRSTNQFLDIRSDYRWLKSQANFVGRYSKVNEYNAQIAQAEFDDFDPENPVEDSTGRVQFLSQTITRIQLRPSYSYKFTPRVAAGASAFYQTVSFDSDIGATGSDYDYSQGKGFLTWTLDQKTDLETAVSVSQFEADDGSNKTDSKGLSVELTRRWTETFAGLARLEGDRSEIERPGRVAETVNGWGFGLGAQKAGEVSKLRFLVGRTFSPSVGGSRTTIDNAQVQYDRDLSARWAVGSAARYFRTRTQGSAVSEDDRDFGRADVVLRRLLTQTVSAGVGYSYFWQSYEVDDESGDDHMFLVSISYQGLAPQR